MKNIVFIVFACLCLLGCAQKQQQAETKFSLKGNIEGLKDGTTVQLVPFAHHAEPVFAETTVKDGKFAFEGTMKEPLLMMLKVKDSYGMVYIMLENKTITVEGKAKPEGVSSQDNLPIYSYSATVKGSALTDHFKLLASVRDSLDKIRNDFNARYREIVAARQKAYAANDTKKLQELEQSETYKAMMKEDEEFFYLVEKSYNKVFLDNKETFWGPLMLLALSSYLTPEQKGLYEQFSQEAKDSYYGKLVYEELYPAGKIGQAVQPFTVKDDEGKEQTLQSLYAGKKYVLIDFWASWCGPCRKEIPNLKTLYTKYAGKGFQIVSISIDKDHAAWQKALKEEGLEWPNFCSNEVANLYRVKAVPTMYLIDGKGILVALDLRGQALTDKLSELFGE